MHMHHAKEQGLMVTSARLLCMMLLLSFLLLAVIANGIVHSHRLREWGCVLVQPVRDTLLPMGALAFNDMNACVLSW